MYADRKLSERSWSLLIGKLEELDYFCRTMLNDFVDDNSTEHIFLKVYWSHCSVRIWYRCFAKVMIVLVLTFFVLWLYLSVDCYIMKIKTIYCHNSRFFRHIEFLFKRIFKTIVIVQYCISQILLHMSFLQISLKTAIT